MDNPDLIIRVARVTREDKWMVAIQEPTKEAGGEVQPWMLGALNAVIETVSRYVSQTSAQIVTDAIMQDIRKKDIMDISIDGEPS